MARLLSLMLAIMFTHASMFLVCFWYFPQNFVWTSFQKEGHGFPSLGGSSRSSLASFDLHSPLSKSSQASFYPCLSLLLLHRGAEFSRNKAS